tara:strand:- start:5515 stop:6267 length:753 start_codon:yes stop_codon:yes gene_type:complete
MKISLLCFALSLLIFSCKKESTEPQVLVDLPFKVGEYDANDYHVLYSSPQVYDFLPQEVIDIDLDGDSSPDLGLGYIWSTVLGNISTRSLFLEANDLNPSWEIASHKHLDSIYACRDTSSSDPWLFRTLTYYSLNSNYNCTRPINEFHHIRDYGVPSRYLKGLEIDSTMMNADFQNSVEFYSSDRTVNPSVGTYRISNNYYENYPFEHYLVLRKKVADDYQYAWLRVRVNLSSESSFQIYELAIQALGSN